jgi:phage protein D
MDLLGLFSFKRQPAECIVEIDGAPIDDLYPSLVEVDVQADRTDWTIATLIFETRRMEDGSWVIQDDARLQPWKSIKIEAAFGEEVEEVMRGYIKDIRAEYPAEKGAARVTVSCQDESLLMDRLQREQRWGEDAPTTDGQIATTIAERNGLTILAPPTPGQTVQDLLQNATDIRFLKTRADANGYEVILRSGQVHFGERRMTLAPQATIKVYAGTDTNCISFNVRDDGHQPDRVAYQVAAATGTEAPAVEVESNLPLLGTTPANSVNSGLENFTWRLRREGVSDDTQAAALAQRSANDAAMRISADGELDGSLYGHVLRTGEPVGVDGVGEKNSGIYYVDAASHKFDVNGYRISFRLSRNAYGDNLPADDNPLAGVL